MRREIADFIREGVYFDSPSFDPDLRSPEAQDLTWHTFAVTYEADRAPIRFLRTVDRGEIDAEIAEAIDAAKAKAADPRSLAPLEQHLKATRQLITIEVDRDELDEDAWFAVDAIEAWLARSCDGIILAPADGFYDQDLQPSLRTR